MSVLITILVSLASLVAGAAAGQYLKQVIARKKLEGAKQQAESLIEEAKLKFACHNRRL